MERARLLLARAQFAPRGAGDHGACTTGASRDASRTSLRCRVWDVPPPPPFACSLGKRHAILEGNVKRVLARYRGVKGYGGDRKIADRLWRRRSGCCRGAASRPTRRD